MVKTKLTIIIQIDLQLLNVLHFLILVEMYIQYILLHFLLIINQPPSFYLHLQDVIQALYYSIQQYLPEFY